MVTGELNSLAGLKSSHDINEAEDLRLDLLLSDADLKFFLYDCKRSCAYRLGILVPENAEYWREDELKDALRSLRSDLPNISNVHCAYAGLEFSLMPSVLTDEELNKAILDLSFGSLDQEIEQIDAPQENVKIIYRKPSFWKLAVTSAFPMSSFGLLVESQLMSARHIAQKEKRTITSFYQGADFIQLVVEHPEKGLLLANIYSSESTEDSLYFISHVFNSLELDQSEDLLCICGDVEPGGILHNTLQSYFAKLEVVIPEKAPLSDGFPKATISGILRPEVCA